MVAWEQHWFPTGSEIVKSSLPSRFLRDVAFRDRRSGVADRWGTGWFRILFFPTSLFVEGVGASGRSLTASGPHEEKINVVQHRKKNDHFGNDIPEKAIKERAKVRVSAVREKRMGSPSREFAGRAIEPGQVPNEAARPHHSERMRNKEKGTCSSIFLMDSRSPWTLNED